MLSKNAYQFSVFNYFISKETVKMFILGNQNKDMKSKRADEVQVSGVLWYFVSTVTKNTLT